MLQLKMEIVNMRLNGRTVACTEWEYTEDIYESSIVTKVSAHNIYLIKIK